MKKCDENTKKLEEDTGKLDTEIKRKEK